ncbi:MAG: U3 snoRNP protein [Vezdaea aestivalis]|nr:MAG: U3 snoRNP protein [Vezdaea aestivalis]
MSGVSDKARFYLEQSVPELQELERKKVFSKVKNFPSASSSNNCAVKLNLGQSEIRTLVKKRSDFEHKINARGCVPRDFSRYINFELHLEQLRKERFERLGLETKHRTGQRRIFFLLDRATRKFYGDIELWTQYIKYAQSENSSKRLEEIFTNALRLHSKKPELWILAASHSLEAQTDMHAARKYMQRGIRFCKSSRLIWLEYAKLELIYIAKIFARRKILGLDNQINNLVEPPPQTEQEDEIRLPLITMEDINPNSTSDEVEERALKKLESSPVFAGDIPVAVFDAAMEELGGDTAALEYFDLFAQFKGLPCLGRIIRHVLSFLQVQYPESWITKACFIEEPVLGLDVSTPQFPVSLASSLTRIKETSPEAESSVDFNRRIVYWTLSILKEKELDNGLRQVLEFTLQRSLERLAKVVGTDAAELSQGGQLASALEEVVSLNNGQSLIRRDISTPEIA